MGVVQISIGRFHHFNLARQLEKNALLEAIWTGYPRFKLKDEIGIPKEKIKTFPWLQTPYMMRSRFRIDEWDWLNKEWAWWAQETLDRYVSSKIKYPSTLIALSGSGLHAGNAIQQQGGFYICDRGSSHIKFQNDILKEEYKRWGFTFQGIDPRIIEKEQREYKQANFITVPSTFVKDSFVKMGVQDDKIITIPYGARLERFKKVSDPPSDKFTVIWVGSVCLRKGFPDLLEAFRLLKHPTKELIIVGSVTLEIKELLKSKRTDSIVFMGNVDNSYLSNLYSSAHVFVLPSIEEGFGMVMGEALACGCPVIATNHTGATELFTNGVEGFIIPIRSPVIISNLLQQLSDDNSLRLKMSEAAISRVKSLGGWDTYGSEMSARLRKINTDL